MKRKFRITMTNPNGVNPEAKIWLYVGEGTHAEVRKLVDQYRAEYPDCYIGFQYSC